MYKIAQILETCYNSGIKSKEVSFMKATIEDGCIGCGQCADTCPEVFRMGDDDLAEVYADVTPDNEESAKEAADGCPVEVIIVE